MNANDAKPLFTIGHSNVEAAAFVGLLRQHGVQTVADVRSSPYSQYTPQFNREILQVTLKQAGVRYVFLGDELGARRAERECYENGQAVYERIAQTPLFKSGLERLLSGAQNFRIALMCAEKDPLTCHRTILICRNLKKRAAELRPAETVAEIEIQHIHSDGHLESHAEAETRLLQTLKLPPEDLFKTPAEILNEAYALQGRKIAYAEEGEGGEAIPAI